MHWVQFTIYAAQCILCNIYGTCWIEPSVTEACDKLQNFMNLHCKGKLNSWLPTQKKFQIICKKKNVLFDHLQRWTPVPRTPSAIASVSEKAKWRGKPTRRWLADILCSSCTGGCGRWGQTHKSGHWWKEWNLEVFSSDSTASVAGPAWLKSRKQLAQHLKDNPLVAGTFSGPTAFPWKLRAVRSPDRRRRFMIKSRNVFSTCSVFILMDFIFRQEHLLPELAGCSVIGGWERQLVRLQKFLVHDRIFFAQQYLFHLRPNFKGKEPGQIAWQEVALGKVEASLRSSKSPNAVVEAGER